jgi:tetratricopeptide (TPR) repeat protein
MELLSIIAFFRSVLSTLSGALPIARRLAVERKAGREPHSVAHDHLDTVLNATFKRLGAITANDPLWRTVGFGVGALFTRAEEFHKPHVQEWLSRTDVQRAVKALTRQRASGAPEGSITRGLLVDTYMAASGEDRHHADSIIETTLAIFCASLNAAASDKGLAALTQAGFKSTHEAISELEHKLGKLAAHPELFVDGVLADHHESDARSDLQAVLRRRASPQARTLAELKEILSEIEVKGKYRGAPISVKADVLYWVARVLAAEGKIDEAEDALCQLKKISKRNMAIPEAWLAVARNDPDTAIQLLRDRSDADARTAIFAILHRAKGLEEALTWYGLQSQHTPEQFTAVGWRNVGATLIEGCRYDEAVQVLRGLPDNFVGECPALGYVMAIAYTTQFVPEARRHLIAEEKPLALRDRLLEGGEADQWRRKASDTFLLTRNAAVAARDDALVGVVDFWLQWLRLADPAKRSEEIAAIKEAMMDGAKAVDLVQFAQVFDIEFDATVLEKYLMRQEAYGGLSVREHAAKLYLLSATGRNGELADFVAAKWNRLLESAKPAELGTLLIESLTRAGQCTRAEEALKLHEGDLHPSDIPRLNLMIARCKGEDPTALAFANYQQTGEYVDLWNLVAGLTAGKRWAEMTPFARSLFDAEPTIENALRYVNCLRRTKAPDEVALAFLENIPELARKNADLTSAMAWALFRVGRIEEARQLNERLLSSRRNPNDIGLDINIAIRLGDWSRFAEILGREWDRRGELPIHLLLDLAKLAGTTAPERALQLAQEAVNRHPDDSNILLRAFGVATALARDDIAMPWIHQAAELSKKGGPVTGLSTREAIKIMAEHAESWRKKNELFRAGNIPLHWAAAMFNMPLSQLLIAIPRQNKDEADARRRYPVPIRSGARRPIEVGGINRIVFDVTSLVILSEWRCLDAAVTALSEVYISPRTMEFLLHEKEKIEFHQPSRIKQAKLLLGLLDSGRIVVVSGGFAAPSRLVAEVGDELAALLETARSSGGVCVHSGLVYKASSYMDQEAELGEHASCLTGLSAVANALHEEGRLDDVAYQNAVSFLRRVSGSGEGTATIAAGAPVYLDSVAAQYLLETDLLVVLANSGHRVFVYSGSIERWKSLVEAERHTETMSEALGRLRDSLRQGLTDHKIRFLREGRKDEDDEGYLGFAGYPIIDILEDGGRVDAACIDDRLLNAQQFLQDNKARRVPLLCSFDIIDLLVSRGVIDDGRRRACVNLARQWGFFALPISADELIALLRGRTVDTNGDLKESAELRAIRENLSRVHSAGVLTRAEDLNYLDHLWHVGLEAVRALWAEEGPSIDETRARADWVLDHVMPDVELALKYADNRDRRVEALATARLATILRPPAMPIDRRKEWVEWLERRVVGAYLPANSSVVADAASQISRWIIERSREAENEFAKSDRPDRAPDTTRIDH